MLLCHVCRGGNKARALLADLPAIPADDSSSSTGLSLTVQAGPGCSTAMSPVHAPGRPTVKPCAVDMLLHLGSAEGLTASLDAKPASVCRMPTPSVRHPATLAAWRALLMRASAHCRCPSCGCCSLSGVT